MIRRSILQDAEMPVAAATQLRTTATDGRPHATTVGGDRCLNMRRGEKGIETFASPEVLALCSGRPVFADTRLGTLHIFTLDNGVLRIEVTIAPDGTVTTTDREVAVIGGEGCRAVRADDFIIIADEEDRLYYMSWNSRTSTYDWLGSLPDMPTVSVEPSTVTARQSEIGALTFPHVVTDLRPGVPDETARSVAEGVAAAITEARAGASAAGYWTSPVMVRIAVRMWDGTLLHLSSPQLLAPIEYVSPRRVLLPVTSTSSGFNGTGVARISIPVYRIRVEADASQLARWRDVASQIEVWVTRQAEVMVDDTPTVGYSSTDGAHTMAVTPGFTTDSELTRRLMSSPWLCVATLPCTSGATTSVVVHPFETDDMVMEPATPTASRFTHAEAIAGHGGFLHMAGCTRSLPLPSLPSGEYGATQTPRATVVVTLGSSRGGATVTARGTIHADNGVILPLIWYPDRTAVSATVMLEYPDGRLYSRQWAMSPVAGENAACVPMTSTEGVTLLPVTSLPAVDTSAGGEYIDSTVVTMRRGNPFVTRATTSGAGGHITRIHAQQSGGGAYTRQYLYLFSDTGIVALTHDMHGYHTNCRPVSRQRVTGAGRVAEGDTAVWALSDSGQLLRLTDAKVATMLRGVGTHYCLGASDTSGELWLIPDETAPAATLSMVLDITANDTVGVSESDRMPPQTLMAGERLLGLTPRAQGGRRVWEVSELTLPARDSTRMGAEWLSPVIETGLGGAVTALIDVRGRAPSAEIGIYALHGSQSPDSTSADDTLLWRGRLTHPNGRQLAIPLLLPDATVPGVTAVRLRFKVSGTFERIVAFGIAKPE